MVKITNGQITLTVSNAAYRSMYKSSGFHLISDEERVSSSADTFPVRERETLERTILAEEKDKSEEIGEVYDDNDEEAVDLSEIPLSEMDFYQLCDYADQLGLDRRGLRSKKELRVLIRNNT